MMIRLTPRETTVLAHCANGRTEKEIAVRIGVTPHSIKQYLTLAYARLGAVDRPHAVARALALGALTWRDIDEARFDDRRAA